MKELLKTRKGFNFYRSYYDVFCMLSEKDRLNFITAILEKQFEGKDIELDGMALLAYTGQKHSIDKQVEGFINKTKPSVPPTEPPYQDPSYVSNDIVMTTEPPSVPPYQQEKEEEQEKEKEEGQVQVEVEDAIEQWLNKRKK
jgi:hypothetical protein